MRAGTLRQRVEVEARDDALDGAGQPTDAWTPVATVWAAVEPLRGAERLSAREAGQEATHQVRMRWNPGFRVNGEWRIGRILHDGRALIPEGPPMDVDERRTTVEVLCIERTDPT